MGGALILCCDRDHGTGGGATWSNASWVVLLVTLAFGAIGWIDELRKVVHRNPKGLSARSKAALAIAVRLAAAWYLGTLAQSTPATQPADRPSSSSRLSAGRGGLIVLTYFVTRHLQRGQPDRGRTGRLAIMPTVLVAGALGIFATRGQSGVFPNISGCPTSRARASSPCSCGALVAAAWAFSGSNAYRRKSLGRSRRARARRRARHHRGDRAPGDRAVHHGRVFVPNAVGDDPGDSISRPPAASAFSVWRRCTTTTS